MSTPVNESMQRLADLIGVDALAKLQAEFGGSKLYIPSPDRKTGLTSVRMPRLFLSGVFDAQVPMAEATQTVMGAAYALHSLAVIGLVVEVEAIGVGAEYLDRIKDVLTPNGIKVRPLGSNAGARA